MGAPVEGDSPLYKLMKSGVLRRVAQDEQGTPTLEAVRVRGGGGWSEVEVWEDGGHSIHEVAVKHLASLRLSRIYRPMRTLDESRPASNEDATTLL